MEKMELTITEKEIDDLVKYKNILNNSSFATTLGIYFFVIGVILLFFGVPVGGAILGEQAGYLLGSTGPFGIGLGILVLLVAFPIKVYSEPKYNDAVKRTEFDSVNTPEKTKIALFNYLRNQGYGKKDGRISCAIGLIQEVSGDDAMDVIINMIEDQTFEDPVRSTAVERLGGKSSIDQERAIQLLIRYLEQDPSAKVRSSAAFALGHKNSPKALMPLRAARSDADQQVRKSAKEALKMLKKAGIR